MDYLKLIAILFGATGFWKLIEIALKFRIDNRKQRAEITNLEAQSQKQISENWIQWSQALERRVKELEAVAQENKELKRQIESQRQRIGELEGKVERVEKENEQLRTQIQELTNSQQP